MVIIKLDLNKAYDHLEWSFIEDSLRGAALPHSLIFVVMRMVSTGSCRLIWNGENTDSIKPSIGLRQGDPLSLHLFVLCKDKLGHWLRRKVAERRLREVRASRRGIGLAIYFLQMICLYFLKLPRISSHALRRVSMPSANVQVKG